MSKETVHAKEHAREAEKAPYVFPGVWKFVEEIATGSGRDLHQMGRTREIWHLSRLQDALGQIPRMDPESRKAALEQVDLIIDGLSLALEAARAARDEVVAECEIPDTKGKKH